MQPLFLPKARLVSGFLVHRAHIALGVNSTWGPFGHLGNAPQPFGRGNHSILTEFMPTHLVRVFFPPTIRKNKLFHFTRVVYPPTARKTCSGIPNIFLFRPSSPPSKVSKKSERHSEVYAQVPSGLAARGLRDLDKCRRPDGPGAWVPTRMLWLSRERRIIHLPMSKGVQSPARLADGVTIL